MIDSCQRILVFSSILIEIILIFSLLIKVYSMRKFRSRHSNDDISFQLSDVKFYENHYFFNASKLFYSNSNAQHRKFNLTSVINYHQVQSSFYANAPTSPLCVSCNLLMISTIVKILEVMKFNVSKLQPIENNKKDKFLTNFRIDLISDSLKCKFNDCIATDSTWNW